MHSDGKKIDKNQLITTPMPTAAATASSSAINLNFKFKVNIKKHKHHKESNHTNNNTIWVLITVSVLFIDKNILNNVKRRELVLTTERFSSHVHNYNKKTIHNVG